MRKRRTWFVYCSLQPLLTSMPDSKTEKIMGKTTIYFCFSWGQVFKQLYYKHVAVRFSVDATHNHSRSIFQAGRSKILLLNVLGPFNENCFCSRCFKLCPFIDALKQMLDKARLSVSSHLTTRALHDFMSGYMGMGFYCTKPEEQWAFCLQIAPSLLKADAFLDDCWRATRYFPDNEPVKKGTNVSALGHFLSNAVFQIEES